MRPETAGTMRPIPTQVTGRQGINLSLPTPQSRGHLPPMPPTQTCRLPVNALPRMPKGDPGAETPGTAVQSATYSRAARLERYPYHKQSAITMRCPANSELSHRHLEVDMHLERPLDAIQSHTCDYDDCTAPYRWRCDRCGAHICDRHSHPGTPRTVKSWVCDPHCLN